MKKLILGASALAAVAMLAGCGDRSLSNSAPLVFATATDVGINVQGPQSPTGAGLVIGYRDAAVALVPTVDAEGKPMGGRVTGADGATAEDAYSTLVQFDSQTSGSNIGVGFGKIAATGVTSQKIGDGIRDRMSIAVNTSTTSQ